MPLSETHQKYLARDQVIGPFVINFLINALAPWLAFRDLPQIDVWGSRSVFGDMVATMFVLPLLICLIATPLVRRLARKGKAPIASESDVPAWLLKLLPRGLGARALVTGTVVCLVTSPLILGFLVLTGWEQVGVPQFAITKGVFCGVLAAVISPPLALRAMAEVATAEVEQPKPA